MDVIETVAPLTAGQGVALAVDPVGATLQTSLAALRPEGRLVFVGNAGASNLQLDLWPALQQRQPEENSTLSWTAPSRSLPLPKRMPTRKALSVSDASF